jgi:hypothetical protein
MPERRFNETEIAEILERAAKTDLTGPRSLPAGEGMTLAELQDIGREAGITSEAIRDAANAVRVGNLDASRQFFGLPLGVGRTAELDRQLTDDEWERFVVDLRETFDARGRVQRDGSLRSWTNGNLQVMLEPTATGSRVRMRSLKSDARALMMAGLGVSGVSVATLIAAGIAGASGQVADIGIMAAIGAALFTLGALRVPGWARTRRGQMELLAARLVSQTTDDQSMSKP